MGLDMYAYTSKQPIASFTPDDLPEDAERIHQWRKHPNLHGWMETLFYKKGGRGDFNCQPLALTREDLSDLEATIKRRALPTTSGFFFGSSFGDEQADDLDFVRKAREAMLKGLIVYYDSWW